jgi:hypothetical protein
MQVFSLQFSTLSTAERSILLVNCYVDRGTNSIVSNVVVLNANSKLLKISTLRGRGLMTVI